MQETFAKDRLQQILSRGEWIYSFETPLAIFYYRRIYGICDFSDKWVYWSYHFFDNFHQSIMITEATDMLLTRVEKKFGSELLHQMAHDPMMEMIMMDLSDYSMYKY